MPLHQTAFRHPYSDIEKDGRGRSEVHEEELRSIMSELAKQKCAPCEGGVAPMGEAEATKHLAKLKDWELSDKQIEKTFTFKDFREAMAFVNSVANIAEQEDHHPEIEIKYNKVEIELSTHSIKGLSLNDFILAAKIDEM